MFVINAILKPILRIHNARPSPCLLASSSPSPSSSLPHRHPHRRIELPAWNAVPAASLQCTEPEPEPGPTCYLLSAIYRAPGPRAQSTVHSRAPWAWAWVSSGCFVPSCSLPTFHQHQHAHASCCPFPHPPPAASLFPNPPRTAHRPRAHGRPISHQQNPQPAVNPSPPHGVFFAAPAAYTSARSSPDAKARGRGVWHSIRKTQVCLRTASRTPSFFLQL